MELARLNHERAMDAVYNALRQGILSRLFSPGERLRVNELAAKLGVSFTPVRHAVQRLATEGLVEIRPRSGTFVASLSTQDIEETFEIRCALECLAAEKAVNRITADDIRRLKELLRALRGPVRTEQDRKEHERANSELHGILVRTSGNRRLTEMYESLNAHLKIARLHSAGERWKGRLRREHAEHEEIVAALEARDARRLIPALRNHINGAKKALVEDLR